MPAETEEKYHLENGLPQFQRIPDAVHEFHQKYGHYPAKVIINPKHQVEWREYFMLTPTKLAPSIKPLENKDIEAPTVQGYHIAIEYDEEIDVKTIICRGFAIS